MRRQAPRRIYIPKVGAGSFHLLQKATTHVGWLRIVPPFALGCALHMVWRALPRRPDASLAGPAIAAATAISAGAAAMLAGLPDAVVVAAAGALILALAALPPRAGRGGSMAALVYLGEVSFSLYMMVMPGGWSTRTASGTCSTYPTRPSYRRLRGWAWLPVCCRPLWSCTTWWSGLLARSCADADRRSAAADGLLPHLKA